MAYQPRHPGGHGIVSLVFGVFLGSYLQRHRHQPKRVGRNSPLRGLDARQAMTAVAFGRILGNIAMAVFLGYYAYTMSHL
jgi:hypothetical protein